MNIKIISSQISKPELKLTTSLKTKLESIFTLFKNSEDVPLGMGYDGTLNDFVAKLKTKGIHLNGNQAKRLLSKAQSYLKTKYPQNIPNSDEHKSANPSYYS